jgi:hypothetical protein
MNGKHEKCVKVWRKTSGDTAVWNCQNVYSRNLVRSCRLDLAGSRYRISGFVNTVKSSGILNQATIFKALTSQFVRKGVHHEFVMSLFS